MKSEETLDMIRTVYFNTELHVRKLSLLETQFVSHKRSSTSLSVFTWHQDQYYFELTQSPYIQLQYILPTTNLLFVYCQQEVKESEKRKEQARRS